MKSSLAASAMADAGNMTHDDPAPASLLRLDDVRKSYSVGPVATEVLRGVRLDVARGDLLSIMGPSGCGKSTLMNLIGLLDRPSSGAYVLDGEEVTAMDDDEISVMRNRRIGFVFQSFHLLPRLTAAENVGLPLVYRGLPQKDIRRQVEAGLERLGMEAFADRRPSELSGGQQQRIAIARSLIGAPALLLADEPTGALDQETSRDIMRLLIQLNVEEELTIVIVTHDAAVDRQCRRRTRISEGVLREEIADGAAAQAVAH